MSKVALVTGGAGFVGSHLCDLLLEKGYKVVAYDNMFAGSKRNLKTVLENANFKLVEDDIRNKKELASYIKDSDVIFHLAAIVGVDVVVNNPLENIAVNMEGVMNIAELAYKYGKKKVLFTSSSEVYGKNPHLPLNEDTTDSLFGTTKVNRWAYGMAKALGEQVLLSYADKGLPIAIIRYFNCFGPRGINKHYANVIPKFIQLAVKNEPIIIYGDGQQTRCFCYVKDTARGTWLAMEKLDNDIVNVGNNKEQTILSLAEEIKVLCNSKSEIVFLPEDKVYGKKFEGAKRRVPSVIKAKKLIGFKPEIGIQDALKETIEWTKENMNILV